MPDRLSEERLAEIREHQETAKRNASPAPIWPSDIPDLLSHIAAQDAEIAEKTHREAVLVSSLGDCSAAIAAIMRAILGDKFDPDVAPEQVDDALAALAAAKGEIERLRNVLTFVACGYACVHYPDQDRDHPGIQYPHCDGGELHCPVAAALEGGEDA